MKKIKKITKHIFAFLIILIIGVFLTPDFNIKLFGRNFEFAGIHIWGNEIGRANADGAFATRIKVMLNVKATNINQVDEIKSKITNRLEKSGLQDVDLAFYKKNQNDLDIQIRFEFPSKYEKNIDKFVELITGKADIAFVDASGNALEIFAYDVEGDISFVTTEIKKEGFRGIRFKVKDEKKDLIPQSESVFLVINSGTEIFQLASNAMLYNINNQTNQGELITEKNVLSTILNLSSTEFKYDEEEIISKILAVYFTEKEELNYEFIVQGKETIAVLINANLAKVFFIAINLLGLVGLGLILKIKKNLILSRYYFTVIFWFSFLLVIFNLGLNFDHKSMFTISFLFFFYLVEEYKTIMSIPTILTEKSNVKIYLFLLSTALIPAFLMVLKVPGIDKNVFLILQIFAVIVYIQKLLQRNIKR